MHQRLKERLVGAAVLVVLAVIFIPMLLTGPIDSSSITQTNIPERPGDKFNAKLVPLSDTLKPKVEDLNNAEQSTDNANEHEVTKNIEVKPENIPSDATKAEKPTTSITKQAAQKKIIKEKQVGLTAWVVQLGSFSSKVNADKLNLTLRKEGFPAFVEPLTSEGKTSYRVRVGPEILRADADLLLKNIKSKMKLDGIVLNYP